MPDRRLTISIAAPGHEADQELLTLDLHGGMTIADLKALIESETTFPGPAQYLYHNGQLLLDHEKTLETLGIVDGEMLAMHVRDPAPHINQPSDPTTTTTTTTGPPGSRRERPGRGGPPGTEAGQGGAGGPDAETIRLQILGNPRARAEIQSQNPELSQALDDPDRFRRVYGELQRQQAEVERRRQREIAMLNEDPFNVENQRKIEESIRREAVMENLQNALEFHPEGTLSSLPLLSLSLSLSLFSLSSTPACRARVTGG